MIRGLYTSGWSMLMNSKQMDVVSNNLANVNTNGFKRDSAISETFPEMLTRRMNDTGGSGDPQGKIGNMSLGSDVSTVFTYYDQGPIVNTKSNLDFAIADAPTSFFAVGAPDQTGAMKEYYTRDGSFALNASMQLITKEGYPVLGEDGPITLNGEDFTVEGDGTVIQDGKTVGKLLLRNFTDSSTLRKIGNNMVERTPQTQESPFQGKVMQGNLEQSNVNIIKEMVSMINIMRSYEASQKILTAQDGTLGKAVNEVGSVR